MIRLKYLTTINPSLPRNCVPLPDDVVSFLPMERISEDGLLDLSEVRPAREISQGYTAILDGDVVIAKITPCFENGKGALCLGLHGGVGYGTTELIVLRTKNKTDSRYLYWLTRSYEFRNWGEAEMTGSAGQKRVTHEFVSNFLTAELQPTHQRRIAAYLDDQTAKIDRLMEMRRRQMELLKEQRAALIQQAVTRGLNPDAPMKDSGIPWLGEIPAHWEVKRGRFLVLPGRSSVKPGPFGTQLKTSDYIEEGIKVFNQETVISKDFLRGDDYITPQKFSDLKEFEVQGGDLLLTTRGTIGRCGVVNNDEVKAIIHPCLMRVRFNPQLMTNDYAVAYIEDTNLFLQQVNYMSNATTIEVIYSENFRQIIFPVPPIKEQQEIAAWICNPDDPVLQTIDGYVKQLTLLAEYRAALIHECVTGQREV